MTLSLLTGCEFSAAEPERDAHEEQEPGADLEAEIEVMLVRLNEDRARYGLGALVYDAALAEVARAHSEDMEEARFFGHASPSTGRAPDRLLRAGYGARVSRENVAFNQGLEAAEDELMASPGHRENILAEDVTHVGIGVAVGTMDGSPGLYVTQVFATPGTILEAANARGAVDAQVRRARALAMLEPLERHPGLDALAQLYVMVLDRSSATDPIGEAIGWGVLDLEDPRIEAMAARGVITSVSEGVSIPEEAASPEAFAYGVGVVEDRDEEGYPVVKILILIAMRQGIAP